ncbi:MAG: hypothetical protein WC467_03270 [Patescibacteria group bacterium]
MVIIGSLLSFSVAAAKNFTIYNAANINQPYFTVNGTNGNVGIGMTNPTALFQILNNGWISANNAAGTGVVNMFKVNANDQIEVGAPLNIGSFEFSPDSGLVTFVDMPVTSAALNGTPEAYVFKLDGENIMSIIAQSNGLGGITNKGVGIGTTAVNDIFSIGNAGVAPAGSANTGHNFTSTYLSSDDYALANYGLVKTMIGSATGSILSLWGGTYDGNIWNGAAGAGNVGIGTITPAAKLDVDAGQLTAGQTVSIMRIHGGYNGNSATVPSIDFMNTGTATNYAAIRFPTSSGGSNIDTAFWTKGSSFSEVMRLQNGNVGIGTTNPLYTLDVATSTRIGTTNNGKLYMGGIGILDGNSTTQFAAQSIGNLILEGDSDNNSNATYSNIIFKNNASEKMRIDDLGNVGIGTTNPGAKLSLDGTGLAAYSTLFNINLPVNAITGFSFNDTSTDNRGLITADSKIGSTGNRAIFAWQVGNFNGNSGDQGWITQTVMEKNSSNSYIAPSQWKGWKYIYYDGTAYKTPFVLTNAGNVGIGTTAPNDLLSIGNAGAAPAGSGSTGHNFTNTYLSSDDYALANYGLVKTMIGTATSGAALWGGTTGGNIWNLNTANNVGIGTTTPIAKLDVNGNSIFRSELNSSNYFNIRAYADNYKTMTLYVNSSEGESRVLTARGSTLGGAFQAMGIGPSSWVHGWGVPGNIFFRGDETILGAPIFGEDGFAGGTHKSLAIGTPQRSPSVGWGTTDIIDLGTFSIAANTWGGIRPALRYTALEHNFRVNNTTGSGNPGTSALFIKSDANVGIGTTVPNDIFSIGNAGSAPAGSGNTGHNFTNTYLSSDDYALANYGLVKTMIGTATSGAALWGGSTGGNIWNLNSANNVGIGTTAPGNKLGVAGGISAYTLTLSDVDGNTFINTPGGNMANYSDTSGVFGYGDNTLNILSGNVGIGTTNPTAPLSVEANSYNILSLYNSGVGQGMDFVLSDENLSAGYPGRLGSYGVGGGEALVKYGATDHEWGRILYTTGDGLDILGKFGNVGIGTTEPNDIFSIGNAGAAPAGSGNTGHNFTSTYLSSDDYALTNVGYVNSVLAIATSSIETSISNAWIKGGNNVSQTETFGTHTNYPIPFIVNNNEVMRLQANGSLSLGGGTSTTVRLHVETPQGPVALFTSKLNGGLYSGYIGNGATFSGEEFGLYDSLSDTRLAVYDYQNSLLLYGGALAIDNNLNYVGIGTTAPNDIFSIGNNGDSAPGGSSNTGHNFTNTYLSSDDYALVNYGMVKTLIDTATSSIAWIKGGNNVTRTELFGTLTDHPLPFIVNNTEVMRLQSNGSVSIGGGVSTTVRLHVETPQGPVALFTSKLNGGLYSGYLGNGATFSGEEFGLYDALGDTRLAVYDYQNSLLLYGSGITIDNSTNYVGIGTTAPNDIFSIGNGGLAALAGSLNTGHNFTSTYLNTDDYALANTGYVKSLIAAATSTISTSTAVTSIFLTSSSSGGSLTYTGGYVGYDAGNKICNAVSTGSHFCRTDEIIYLIQANGSAGFSSINGQDAWIADGPPGYTGVVSADDCGGWVDSTNSKLGHFWIFASAGGGRGSLSSCDTIKKITCCK